MVAETDKNQLKFDLFINKMADLLTKSCISLDITCTAENSI
ncbi:hypothetical protein SAMN05878281_0656 [Salegentibacter salegens]|uniref:Uncharacterized protein n=1 Tax=Salegentibacter salegens TaxID=143223 RepID=A0A1M7IQN3_9FLAO|nr:hypothetical protein LY58_00880 [Salegentibacter salegens]SHM43122.1 hypothetical protein SAMN05878281_0656 [Salegentibacter salegens]